MDRDRLNGAERDYRPLLRALVEEYVAVPAEGSEGIDDFAVCDDVSGNYIAFASGWQGSERTYGPALHLRIKGEYVIIETYWNDEDLVDRLIEGGVPAEAIVLSWARPLDDGAPVTAATKF
jgi:hypothetical protein